MGKPTVQYINYGKGDYQEVWNLQTSLHQEIVKTKLANRKLDLADKSPTEHFLIICEHPHVYTLGKSGKESHLLLNELELKQKNAQFVKINRGGDITYHGPGQLVGYPLLDLDEFYTDVHRYVRSLEEVIIRTIAEYGIIGTRIPAYTGVWLQDEQSKRKICAIGVHLSRWVTMHGFALNANSSLNYFNHIIPCGINELDMQVTSIQKELGSPVDIEKLKERLLVHFSEVFECDLTAKK
jgi:lipoyl(octanoyl) transferase